MSSQAYKRPAKKKRVWVSKPKHRLLLIRRRPLLNPFLQRKQLLRPERLIMNLRGRLDQVLQVRPSQKVAQVHKLAVSLVFHVHHTPPVLSSAHRLAADNHAALRPNHRERNNTLQRESVRASMDSHQHTRIDSFS